jgi:RNA polymerase sigma-70 factor (ECF subfamily)
MSTVDDRGPQADDGAGADDQHDLSRFRELMKRAQSGCRDASRELYETYGRHVIRCVRQRLWRRMRTRFDSQDFSQQVWASFFLSEQLPNFETPDELMAFLGAMAERKVILENRRQAAQKNNLRREHAIDEHDTHVGYHPAAPDPTPSTLAVYHEQYERIVVNQAPEVREVAQLRLEGNTFREISNSLEIDERTARRFMRRLKRTTPPQPEELG